MPEATLWFVIIAQIPSRYTNKQFKARSDETLGYLRKNSMATQLGWFAFK